MIIPSEYYHLGSLPPHWIIDPLMRYLDCDYYIGLLSAVSLHGATQQQPMTFQVIVNKQMKNIELERGGIEFHYYKNLTLAQKEQITIPIEFVQISTEEQTLVGLIRFQSVCGYMSNVAIVIRDLAENCKADLLA
jgi:predicted transcriptional regulator of viral defense system